MALTILAGIGYGLWRALTPRESDAALLALGLAACGVVIPAAMAVAGADYLAPRNVVAAMVPLTAGIAVIVTAQRTGRVGMAFVGRDRGGVPRAQRRREPEPAPAARGLAGPRAGDPGRRRRAAADRSRGDHHGGARVRRRWSTTCRRCTTCRAGATVRVSEIDETGYMPLAAGAGEPPAPGFHLVAHRDVDGLVLYRFRSAIPRTVSEAALREHVIAEGHPEVLVGAAVSPYNVISPPASPRVRKD